MIAVSNHLRLFPAARCVLPVHLRPHAAAPCRRAPPLTAVSARARRGGRRDRSSWDDGSNDDEDDRIDDSFFGDGAQDEEAGEEEEERQRRPASPAPEPAGQLRGSDVLRALQRAAAAKEAKKRKKTAGAGARQEKKGGGAAKVKTAAAEAEVRPIEIRPEWAARISELELRVRQLLDQYHHHR